MNPECDMLLFDKPYKCTSFDLVGKVRGIARRKAGKKVKVGHAGTLDPLATGLMIICVGKMTKQIDLIQGKDKEYTGTIRLGATTPSFDLEHPVDAEYPYEHITREMAEEAARSLTGDIQQVPPIYSAIKLAGRRAYELAREGEEAPIAAKDITIHEFEITRFELPDVDFRIKCSKGTYIRSIARDFGIALQSGGHLTALRRTRIGEHAVEQAIQPIIVENETF
ncbi:MAG: tRNA pseudouridine(55) synthase TruB [Bacteroidales bacterium]|nr:tRNA pseudouridine(55) synthase TruB [Bacteroidales bacterium]